MSLLPVPPIVPRVYATMANLYPPKSLYRKRGLSNSERRRYLLSIGIERDGFTYSLQCTYCGHEGAVRWDLDNRVYMLGNMQIDHIIPERAGGSHLPENLTPACMSCNLRKGSNIKWQAI